MRIPKRDISRWENHWVDPRAEFKVGVRLFHAVNLATCTLLLLMIPFNIMLGQYKIGPVYIDVRQIGDPLPGPGEGFRCGMPPENQDKIFTLNVQRTKGTNNGTGVGVGLALARQFASRQQIDLGFSHSPDQALNSSLACPSIRKHRLPR